MSVNDGDVWHKSPTRVLGGISCLCHSLCRSRSLCLHTVLPFTTLTHSTVGNSPRCPRTHLPKSLLLCHSITSLVFVPETGSKQARYMGAKQQLFGLTKFHWGFTKFHWTSMEFQPLERVECGLSSTFALSYNSCFSPYDSTASCSTMYSFPPSSIL